MDIRNLAFADVLYAAGLSPATNETSIMDDMAEMKRLADDIIGKGETFIEKQKAYAPHGRCETCGTKLEHEPAWHGTFDQPPSEGGFYCPTCGEWT